MTLSLDGSLLLYTLQTLKEDPKDVSSRTNEGTLARDILREFPTEAIPIPTFINNARHLSPASNPLFVTSIDWRVAPSNQMYHEYVTIRASTCVQAAPIIVIRIDRYGKLGIKVPWWKANPSRLTPNTNRASTTVFIGAVGDTTADPTKGKSLITYTHWTHALPSTISIPELGRALERARRDACTELNHAIRPYASHDLHITEAQTRHGRRWSGARGLEQVHIDIASTLAEAMDAGIIRCAIQGFWAKILPGRALWRSVERRVRTREEYARVVCNYRQELRRIVHSLPALDADAHSRIAMSWGIENVERSSPLIIQLLDKSLSKHAFVSPHAPTATLSDVASRLDTLVPLLPTSGPTLCMCELHAQTLLARFPDELWHAYTTPVPPTPVSAILAVWRRARDSHTFWVVFEIAVQWIIAIALIPVEYVYGLWVLILPFIHTALILPWILKKRKAWRIIWKVYEGGLFEEEGQMWENKLNTLSSQSEVSSLNARKESSH